MDIMSFLLGQQAGGSSKGLKVEVVEELPEIGEANILYLVPKQDTGDNDVFDEWLYIEDEWEHIGSTDIDLSNYYTKSEVYNKSQVDAKIPMPITKITVSYQYGVQLSNLDTIASQNIRSEGIFLIYNSYDSKYVGLIYSAKQLYDSNLTLIFENLQPYYSYKQIARRYQNTSGTVLSNVTFDRNYINLNTVIDSQYRTTPSIIGNFNEHGAFTYSDYIMYLGKKDIRDLNTTNKTSIVDAINEVNTKINNLVDANNTSY